MCGQCPQHYDPYTRRKAKIVVGFYIEPQCGGRCSANNLRAICTTCADGLKGIRSVKFPLEPQTFQEILNVVLELKKKDKRKCLNGCQTGGGLVPHSTEFTTQLANFRPGTETL
jgi:hypothetical protein